MGEPDDEQKKAEEPALEDFYRTLKTKGGLWSMVKQALTIQGWAIVVVAALVGGFAVVQVAAVGASAASSLYRKSWGEAFVFFSCLPIALFVVIFVLLFVVDVIHRLLRLPFRAIERRGGKEASERAATSTKLLIICALVFGFVAFMAYGAFTDARKAVRLPTKADSHAVAQIKEAVVKQQEVNQKLSEGAVALLRDLDDTAGRLNEARGRLAETLVQLDKQRADSANNAAEAERLIEQQKLTEHNAQQMRELLNGKEPVTKDYFDQSGYLMLFYGAIIGAFVSHAPAIYALLRRTKKKP